MNFTTCFRPLVILTGLIAVPVPLLAVDYTWQGGGAANTIVDPLQWLGGIVPPNDGININLTATDRIIFATGAQTIPNGTQNPQINVPAGAQIIADTGGDHKRVEARVNAIGTGPALTGAIAASGAWILPQNLYLTGATSIVTNNGQRFRMDGGPNRLDLQGNTLTTGGNGETNLVNTNVYNTTGTIVSNHIFSIEGSTRIAPTVTLDMNPGALVTSWDGVNHRRDATMTLRNNTIIESRKGDRDLTFTGIATIPAGATTTLRGQIQAVGQAGDGTDQRLNMMSQLTGPGAVLKAGNGTLMLSGASDYAGGTTLTGTGATLAASDAAFGTGTVTVQEASTVHLSNAGGLEFRDAEDFNVAVTGTPTGVNPALTGLHSNQPFDDTRFSYTGKIRNNTGGNVVYSFVEQYDDNVFLTVDGTQILSDTAWNVVTTGQISLAPGEHDIRISAYNGGGGAGPNNGFAYGVGLSTALPLGGATVNAADYTEIGENLEIYQGSNRTIANSFVLNQTLTATTSQMNGYTATLGGNLSGPGGLIVQGSTVLATDQLVLGGANTYAGDTTVQGGGSLRLTGSHLSQASYLIDPSAAFVLDGTLTIGDPNSPSVPADLLINNSGIASFGASSILRLDIFANLVGTPGAAGENDELLTGGTVSLTLAGTLIVLNPNGVPLTLGSSFDLADWNTAPTGTFGTVTLPTLGPGLSWSTSDLYNGGTVTVVPEPSAIAYVAMLAGGALLRRRRRK